MIIKTQNKVLVSSNSIKFIKVDGYKVVAVLSIFYVPEEARTGFYELTLGEYEITRRANEVRDAIFSAEVNCANGYEMPMR